MRRASRFEGVGLCVMHPKEEQKSVEMIQTTRLEGSKTRSCFEPDPEFSRNSTEEPQSGRDEGLSFRKNHWIQERLENVGEIT